MERNLPKWRCWIPDEGQTRVDAKAIRAVDARDAAEEFARDDFTSSDPFQMITVRVAPWDHGGSVDVVDIDVTVETCPEFYASEPRPAHLTVADVP